MEAEVRVLPATGYPGCWVVVCTIHGHLPNLWTGHAGASFDAMGHTAAHHAIPST